MKKTLYNIRHKKYLPGEGDSIGNLFWGIGLYFALSSLAIFGTHFITTNASIKDGSSPKKIEEIWEAREVKKFPGNIIDYIYIQNPAARGGRNLAYFLRAEEIREIEREDEARSEERGRNPYRLDFLEKKASTKKM